MTNGQQLSRLLRLEAQHGGAGACRGCGRPDATEPLPPGRLSDDEIESRALALLGGERLAKWPRCSTCRRLVPLPFEQARVLAEAT